MSNSLSKSCSNSKIRFNLISTSLVIMIHIMFCAITLGGGLQLVFNDNSNSAIYNGNRQSNKVCLMFNVYWGSEYIEDILKVLDTYNIKTTFFVGGQWVEKEPEYLKLIYSKGHEIGNHGYFHKDHDKLSYNQNYEEIKVCHTLVSSTIDYNMNLFAPPSGAFSKTTLEVAQSLGYYTIMWSKDTIDWRDKDSNLVYKRATTNVKGGDLILMHPTQHTLEALPNIIEFYNKNNIVVDTVSKVL